MTYEKPAIRDLGDIAKHTYFIGGDDEGDDGFPGCSGDLCDADRFRDSERSNRHLGPGYRAHESGPSSHEEPVMAVRAAFSSSTALPSPLPHDRPHQPRPA